VSLWGRLLGDTIDLAAAVTAPVAVAAPTSTAGAASRVLLNDPRAVHRQIARSIPAVRKALHVIVGTSSTFALAAWNDEGRLDAADPRTSWLRQPDPRATLQTTLAHTLDDLVWHDVAVWEVLDRFIVGGLPNKFRRVNPSRLDLIRDPLDDDRIVGATLDGAPVTDTRRLLIFDGAGLGGLARFGFDLLDLYVSLQAAAANYATAPHPHAILVNHGADLDAPEIAALLDEWEAARQTRSVGYLNDVVEYETHGWNANELQLVEAREHAALEVARLFGLPADALDATGSGSMTYANVVDRRRDTLEALRPWLTVVEQTLSLDDRTSRPAGVAVPYGVRVRFDVDAYTRDDPQTRMTTWEAAIRSGALTLDEVRAAEPLAATNSAPAPALPAGAGPVTDERPAP